MRNKVLAALMAGVISSGAMAADVLKLYQEPSTSAKVAATVKSGQALVPIFKSKDGQWLKVGDSTNGNVGWLQLPVNKNLKDKPQVYQWVTYSGTEKMTPEEVQTLMANMQARQALMQQQMQRLFNSANAAFTPMDQLLISPVIQPMVIVPVKTDATPSGQCAKK